MISDCCVTCGVFLRLKQISDKGYGVYNNVCDVTV